jgi:hypothetical protein
MQNMAFNPEERVAKMKSDEEKLKLKMTGN